MRLLIVSALVALTACSQKAAEPSTFGAEVVVRAAAEAISLCAAEGFDDLASCTESTDQKTRRAAKAVDDMVRVYSEMCAADLDRQRCDDMLMSAYASESTKTK